MAPAIPLDLVYVILKLLASQSPRCVLACSLVSSAWHGITCSMIFAHFVAIGHPGHRSFAAATQFLRTHPHIAAVTRVLSFRGTLAETSTTVPAHSQDVLEAADVLAVLRLCPVLDTVRVQHCRWLPTPMGTRYPYAAHIRLEMSSLYSTTDVPPSDSLISIATGWHTVRFEDTDWSSSTSPEAQATIQTSAVCLEVDLSGATHGESSIKGLLGVQHLSLRDLAVTELAVAQALVSQYETSLHSVCLHVESDTSGQHTVVLCHATFTHFAPFK